MFPGGDPHHLECWLATESTVKNHLVFWRKNNEVFHVWGKRVCHRTMEKALSLGHILLVLGSCCCRSRPFTRPREEGVQSWNTSRAVFGYQVLVFWVQSHYKLFCYNNFHSIPAKPLTQSQIKTKPNQTKIQTKTGTAISVKFCEAVPVILGNKSLLGTFSPTGQTGILSTNHMKMRTKLTELSIMP